MTYKFILICILSAQLPDNTLTENRTQSYSKDVRLWPRSEEVDKEVYKIANELENICELYDEYEALGWDTRAFMLVNQLKEIGGPALTAIEEIASDKSRNLLLRIIMTERLAFSKNHAVTPSLIELLLDKSESPQMRTNVADLLGRILKDTTATDALIETMKDKSNPVHVRSRATGTFVSLRSKKVIIHLLEILKNDSARDVRAMAAAAIGSNAAAFDDTTVVLPVLEILRTEKDNMVRMMVIESLGAIGDERAIPILIALIDERQVNFRDAIKALGNIGGAEATTTLLELALNDKDEWVRVEAIKALIETEDKSITNEIHEAIGSIEDPGYKRILSDKFSKKFSEEK